MKEEIKVEVSSGNVFTDLGLPEADELQAKSDLIIEIKKIMREKKLTQTQAAEIMSTDQATLSKVLRGGFNGVTTDRLVKWLRRLGFGVKISVFDLEKAHLNPVIVCKPRAKSNRAKKQTAKPAKFKLAHA